MVGDHIPLALPWGTQSPIHVTQGTGRLVVVQGGHVSLMACGQEDIQHVPVSSILETLSPKYVMKCRKLRNSCRYMKLDPCVIFY